MIRPVGRRWIAALVLIVLTTAGCATYYEQNIRFQQHFAAGELDKARAILDEEKGAAKGRNRLLYFFQQGVVCQMLGEYSESNRWFEEAYRYTEDYQKNNALQALSFITNPTVVPYPGEDFEVVLVHYYMALNYLRLGQYDEALVSCRRVNLTLQALNDRYETRKNRYKEDAFALTLMGIAFEASGDVNSAFVSYRNAYEAYVNDYEPSFGVHPPEQLKRDILRTAYLNGFRDELQYYEQAFGMSYKPVPREGGELVFFWMNGLGPVKAEWSINFVLNFGDDFLTFTSDEYGMSFPFHIQGVSRDDRKSLSDLRIVRVAFPKYVEREPLYRTASLMVGNDQYPLELAENVNAIAFSTLEDRMIREFASSLLRLALKQGAEELARKKSDDLGTILSLVNAVTEKADTRNWQTLPHDICYARVPLPEGTTEVRLTGVAPVTGIESTFTFPVTVKKSGTVFQMYHNFQSQPIPADLMIR
jgi:uncharacterized protein